MSKAMTRCMLKNNFKSIFCHHLLMVKKWFQNTCNIFHFELNDKPVFWPSSTQGRMRRGYGSRWSAVTSTPSFTYFGSALDQC